MRQVIFGMLFGVVLGGCASIPLTSMPKLAGLKPETMALEKVQLAVRVQEDFQLYRDGAKLSVGASGETLEVPMTLALELVPSTGELTPYLQGQARRGYRIAMFEVDPEDADDIRAFREAILALKTRSAGQGKHALTISATANGCVAGGANPFQDLRMKLYLRTDEADEFFTLFKEQKLRMGLRADGTGGLTVCTEEDEPNLLWMVR